MYSYRSNCMCYTCTDDLIIIFYGQSVCVSCIHITHICFDKTSLHLQNVVSAPVDLLGK